MKRASDRPRYSIWRPPAALPNRRWNRAAYRRSPGISPAFEPGRREPISAIINSRGADRSDLTFSSTHTTTYWRWRAHDGRGLFRLEAVDRRPDGGFGMSIEATARRSCRPVGPASPAANPGRSTTSSAPVTDPAGLQQGAPSVRGAVHERCAALLQKSEQGAAVAELPFAGDDDAGAEQERRE